MCFTTATITASTLLFQGFNTDNPIFSVSLICGFVIIFSGVYLLDSIARSPDGTYTLHEGEDEHHLLMSETTMLNHDHDEEEALGLTNMREGAEDEGLRRTSRTSFHR